MVRTFFSITEDHERFIKSLADNRKITMSEALRRLLDTIIDMEKKTAGGNSK